MKVVIATLQQIVRLQIIKILSGYIHSSKGKQMIKSRHFTLREMSPYLEFLWPECGKKWTRKTPEYGHFSRSINEQTKFTDSCINNK